MDRMFRIVPVQNAAQLLEFIQVPRLIYRGLHGFEPPLDVERNGLLNPTRAPFYMHGRAMYWIATRNGSLVGRISAQIDTNFDGLDPAHTKIGFFGCLDAIDDATVVASLIETASLWLHGQGRSVMRGPFALSINGESGLLVEGHDKGSMILMPWHPPYLEAHVLSAGMLPIKDLLAYDFDLRALEKRSTDNLHRRALDARLTLRGLDCKNLDQEITIMTGLFNASWQNNWGFVAIDREDIEAMIKGFKPFIHPDCAVIVEWEHEPIAFAFVLPNLFELWGDFDGQLMPFNWLRLLWRMWRKPYRSCRLLLMGVAAPIHGGMIGLLAPQLMITELLNRAKRHKFERVEGSWVLEDNRLARRLIEGLGGTIVRRYRVFEFPLEAGPVKVSFQSVSS